MIVDSTGVDQYALALVGVNGSAVASARPKRRSRIVASGGAGGSVAIPLPEVSASDHRLYYLDGDTDVHSLAPGGQDSVVFHVEGGASVHSAFSVSPDDSRIAVSVIDYSQPQAGLTLYVSDLGGGAKHQIFTSTTNFVWPVGWHAGSLIVAVSPTAYTQNSSTNPYFAFGGYHLVNADTGLRVTALCTSGQAAGPLVPKGDLCYTQSNGLQVEGWDGQATAAPGADVYCYAISPDQSQIACDQSMAPAPQPIVILLPGSSGAGPTLHANGQPQGWFDNTHLIFSSGAGGIGGQLTLIDVTNGHTAPVSAQGSFFGLLPGGL